MPELPWWFLAVFVLGVNFVIWGTVGAIRLTEARAARLGRRHRRGLSKPSASQNGAGQNGPRRRGLRRRQRRRDAAPPAGRVPLTVHDVAVLMPAHNEAAVLGASLESIMKLVPPGNVHVVSDGSTDDTPEIGRQMGAQVHETARNMGKAGALQDAIRHFDLISKYRVIMLLDADTRIDQDYFAQALPMFDAPDVVAVAGCVRTARDRRLSLTGNVLVGHRQRIYAIGQRALKFGQTYLRANATHIVPGFASMYRSQVLSHMELNPPGMVIEDFNMTFEVYQKRLGKVAFTLGAVAETQDPDTLHDYVRQTRRWAVGLWQTVRRHPPKANLFTAMLAVLLLELITSSAMFLVLPLLVLVLVVPDLAHTTLGWPPFADVHATVASHMKLSAVLFGVLIPDYAMTCLVAALERRPRLLLLGVFFPFMRLIDAFIGLTSIPAGWLVRSNGTWKSPARRGFEPATEPLATEPVAATELLPATEPLPATPALPAAEPAQASLASQAADAEKTADPAACGAGDDATERTEATAFAPSVHFASEHTHAH